MTVEPPAHDDRWDDPIPSVAGSWDRDFWLALARDLYAIDEELLADRSTEWIVGRVREEPPRHYRQEAR